LRTAASVSGAGTSSAAITEEMPTMPFVVIITAANTARLIGGRLPRVQPDR
jgi:hypothetical protein